jgi:hypothetical protein
VSAQALTDQQVLDAVTRADKFRVLHLTEALNLYATGYSVDVYSPIAWVQHLAQTAKHELRPFGVSDVTEDMRADVWHVIASPSTPRELNNRAGSASVSHVVIRNENKSVVIQPLGKEPFDGSVQNGFGASLAYTGLSLTFPGDGIRELWGPKQDREFIVSVIGDRWKYDFTIKKKHFQQLQ